MDLESLWTQSEYHTPADWPKALLMRLLPGRWLPFYAYMIGTVLAGRRHAVKGVFDDAMWIERSLQFGCRAEGCGARLHVSGLEHVRDPEGPIVIIGNHMSSLESFLLPSIVAPLRRLTFIVKEGLTKHPFFGPVMRSREPITVSRASNREDFKKVMTQGSEVLAKGISLCVFPQSTRMTEFHVSRFNTLGAKLAYRAKVPIVPLALRTDFWGNGKLLKDFGPIGRSCTVHLAFGPAIPAGTPARDAQAAVLGFLRPNLEAWGVPWVEARETGDGSV